MKNFFNICRSSRKTIRYNGLSDRMLNEMRYRINPLSQFKGGNEMEVLKDNKERYVKVMIEYTRKFNVGCVKWDIHKMNNCDVTFNNMVIINGYTLRYEFEKGKFTYIIIYNIDRKEYILTVWDKSQKDDSEFVGNYFLIYKIRCNDVKEMIDYNNNMFDYIQNKINETLMNEFNQSQNTVKNLSSYQELLEQNKILKATLSQKYDEIKSLNAEIEYLGERVESKDRDLNNVINNYTESVVEIDKLRSNLRCKYKLIDDLIIDNNKRMKKEEELIRIANNIKNIMDKKGL